MEITIDRKKRAKYLEKKEEHKQESRGYYFYFLHGSIPSERKGDKNNARENKKIYRNKSSEDL